MDYDLCVALIEHLDADTKCAGEASATDKSWLTSIGVPVPLLHILQFHWPVRDCTLSHFELMSVASIRREEFTDSLLKYKFLEIGCVLNGDWVVIDLSTDRFSPGYISHEDWSGDSGDDPRVVFAPIAPSFVILLDYINKKQFIPVDYFEALDYNAEIEGESSS
jgi:hypothetical protein